jgi:two-component system, chemotaxis family, response regulator Rcp1
VTAALDVPEFSSSRRPQADRQDNPTLQRQRMPILVVEDNEIDAYLIREALASQGISSDTHVLEDGQLAIDFIDRIDEDETPQAPRLFLLDLNLPKRTGREVLVHIRNSRTCAHVPVLVVSSAGPAEGWGEAKALGATAYFQKPAGYEAFLKVGELVRNILAKASAA